MNSTFRKIISSTLIFSFLIPMFFSFGFLNKAEGQENPSTSSGVRDLPDWGSGYPGSYNLGGDMWPGGSSGSVPSRQAEEAITTGYGMDTGPYPDIAPAGSTNGNPFGNQNGGGSNTSSTYPSGTGSGTTPGTEGQGTASGEIGAGGNGGEGAVGELLSCSVASLMATIFSGALSALGGAVSQLVPDFEVPVKDSTQRSKETGPTVFGIPILPSWDAIAYCLGNLIIAYITQATIEWANTGFGGNPAFVTDPSQFFQAIADIETERFLYELNEGFLCSPYQQGIQRNIATNSLATYRDRATCSFQSASGQDLEGFFNNPGAPNVYDFAQFGRPENLFWSAQNMAGDELFGRIDSQQGEQRQLLNWGDGWFSHRKDGLINLPGNLAADQIQRRVGLSLDRTATAQGINQIITNLLNAVFRAAVGELLNEI